MSIQRLTKTIVVMGTLDTKGPEHLFLKQKIEERGLATVVVDTAIVGVPYFKPDICRAEVCRAAGYELEDLIKKQDRKLSIGIMASGASSIAHGLHGDGKLDGIISLGGSQGTYISTTAMKSLPFGIPKLMVSTTVAGDMTRYVGYKDITLINSPADILVLNSFNRRLFSQAANAICAMTEVSLHDEEDKKHLVGVTMFGVTTPCVSMIVRLFEKSVITGEAIVFHARGTGGRAMEELIDEGVITGVMDITTTELADELVGGIRSAGETRLEAAGRKGLPQIVAPGALDMVNFGPIDEIPKKFKGRKFYSHTPMVTVMRTDLEENRKLGEIFANKLNRSLGKTIVLIPKKGFSELDKLGGPFYDPTCDFAFTKSLKKHLRSNIKIEELDLHINDEAFAQTVINQFLYIMN